MKSILSISFALLILLQSFSMVWIVFSFKMNQEYIAKNLCINRDKPQKKCNGKCHLIKKIKESKEEKPNQAPAPRLDEQRQLDYVNDSAAIELKAAKAAPSSCGFADITFTTQSCVLEIFQPPKRYSATLFS